MSRLLAAALLLAACAPPTPEEHCRDTCRFYSDCNPAVEPLEPMCISACLERFADPKQVVLTCETSLPRETVDRYLDVPSLSDSIIDAGACTRDHGCPPDMADPDAVDPCQDVERICADGLMPQQLCYRTYLIDQDRCQRGYQSCLARGDDQQACGQQSSSCYQQANEAWGACNG